MNVINEHQDLSALDDGTNIDFTYNGTTYYSVNKTTGDMLIKGSIKERKTL